MPIRLLLLALGLCLALPAAAVTRHDLDDPALAAIVNGEPLSMKLVDVMHRIALKGDATVTRATVVQALIDDRLVAANARANYPHEAQIEDNKVAFSPEVQVRQQMVSNVQAAFRDRLEARLKHIKGGTLDGLVLAEHSPTAAEWNAVLGPQSVMVLEYSLSDAGRAAANKVVLLRYRYDGKNGAVTLREIYDVQNVQGRNQLHARNDAFALEEARQLFKQRWILDWARSPEGLGEADFAVFRRAIEDHLVHGGWMAWLGVAADIHEDPKPLKALQAQVTTEEVRAYYDGHRDQFQRIEKVKARHIRVKDEAAANALEARLQKGEAFADLARSQSVADDAASGGDLGWIEHRDQQADWVDSLAFLQKPGVPSRPVRLPGAKGAEPGWEILLVEDRVMGYQPADSQTVRYLASQAIAKQKALDQYQETVARLRREADIRLPSEQSPLARPKEAH
ncbi:MAG TPA: peptidyl-prolyl cis-trans isomerase [Moraxellaceae bacterium]|nr:peptidyl-prolyl cis-trans isomerase [Moraxellaceae bacterium]